MPLPGPVQTALSAANANAKAAADTARNALNTASTTPGGAALGNANTAKANAGVVAAASQLALTTHQAALTNAIAAADTLDQQTKQALTKAQKLVDADNDRAWQLNLDISNRKGKIKDLQNQEQTNNANKQKNQKEVDDAGQAVQKECPPVAGLEKTAEEATKAAKLARLLHAKFEHKLAETEEQETKRAFDKLAEVADAKLKDRDEAARRLDEATRKRAALEKEATQRDEAAKKLQPAINGANNKLIQAQKKLDKMKAELAVLEKKMEVDRQAAKDQRAKAKKAAEDARADTNQKAHAAADECRIPREAALSKAHGIRHEAEKKAEPLLREAREKREAAEARQDDLDTLNAELTAINDALMDMWEHDNAHPEVASELNLRESEIKKTLQNLKEQGEEEKIAALTREAEAAQKAGDEILDKAWAEADPHIAEARQIHFNMKDSVRTANSKAQEAYLQAEAKAEAELKEAMQKAEEAAIEQLRQIELFKLHDLPPLEEALRRLQDEQKKELAEADGKRKQAQEAVPDSLVKEVEQLKREFDDAKKPKDAAKRKADEAGKAADIARRTLKKASQAFPEVDESTSAMECGGNLAQNVAEAEDKQVAAKKAFEEQQEKCRAARERLKQAELEKKALADRGNQLAKDLADNQQQLQSDETEAIDLVAPSLQHKTELATRKTEAQDAASDLAALTKLQADLITNIADAASMPGRPVLQPLVAVPAPKVIKFNEGHTYNGNWGGPANAPTLSGLHHRTLDKDKLAANVTLQYSPQDRNANGVYECDVKRGGSAWKPTTMWPDDWDKDDMQRAANAALQNPTAMADGHSYSGTCQVNGANLTVKAQEGKSGTTDDYNSFYPQFDKSTAIKDYNCPQCNAARTITINRFHANLPPMPITQNCGCGRAISITYGRDPSTTKITGFTVA